MLSCKLYQALRHTMNRITRIAWGHQDQLQQNLARENDRNRSGHTLIHFYLLDSMKPYQRS